MLFSFNRNRGEGINYIYTDGKEEKIEYKDCFSRNYY